jgi:adenosine deaminase
MRPATLEELTGSMRPATLEELTGSMHGATLRELSGQENDHEAGEWAEFQRRYDAARAAIRTVEDLYRVIREAAGDDVRDGSVWLELQASPAVGESLRMREEETIEALLEGCRLATQATGLGIGLILAANWRRPPAEAERLAALAGRYQDRGVVGFGISNDERGTDPAEWRPAFERAKQQGIGVVPHSGFYEGPRHVAACVEQGATRIGHGITAATDPGTMDMLARNGIAVELCPTSYPPFGVVDHLSQVPLRTMRDNGVPVALAADDPLLFGAGLADQYRIARDVLGFGDAELAELARASIRASAMPHQQATLDRVDAWRQEGASDGDRDQG